MLPIVVYLYGSGFQSYTNCVTFENNIEHLVEPDTQNSATLRILTEPSEE